MGAGASARDLASVDDETLVGIIASDPDRIERLLRTARQTEAQETSKPEAPGEVLVPIIVLGFRVELEQ